MKGGAVTRIRPADMSTGAVDFALVFPSLHALAYRVGYRLLGSRADAEDVAAEACARAYLAWSRVSRYPEPWVCRVAGNLAIDVVRRRRREGGQECERDTADPFVERRMDLYNALDSLARRQREVVILRYLADLREEDVARQLRCSVGTVKTHASRALAALRVSLAEVEAGA